MSNPRWLAPIDALGGAALALVAHVGGVALLLARATGILLAVFTGRGRVGKHAVVSQVVRVGVRSVGIVALVSGSVGLILSLQLAPPLDEFGQRDAIPSIVGVAMLRELGPLIAAIVLTGFAGAAIAAEIGTMVVGEEIEALEAHALDPVRFLVVPRILAGVIAMACLAVLADVVSVAASLVICMVALGVPPETFLDNLLRQAKTVDFVTGICKGAVFGLLIGAIACANGLRVAGGAAGVGRATTSTVVQCVVSIILADLIFTSLFFALGLV